MTDPIVGILDEHSIPEMPSDALINTIEEMSVRLSSLKVEAERTQSLRNLARAELAKRLQSSGMAIQGNGKTWVVAVDGKLRAIPTGTGHELDRAGSLRGNQPGLEDGK